MQLFIMQFSPSSCYFLPPKSKYSLQYPVLDTDISCLCSLLDVRDEVPNPHKKKKGKILVLVYFNLYVI